MSSFQAPVGLPPLSAIASVTNVSTPLSTPEITGAPTFGPPGTVEYRDARIKDPVPKKLKGHTDNTSGNFSIMQMDLGGRESSMERDQLAKRSSANTELAAMRAYNSSYPVSSMKRFVRVPDEASAGAWNSYYTTPTTQVPTQAPAQAPIPVPELPRPTHPLTPPETKEEQARLLTLLRSIPPASVVDQICTAVAYFGGMQGAAPPTDGEFPRSELANGTGNVFIGWIAEIFPKLPNETTAAMQAMPRSSLPVANTATARPESSGGVTDSEPGLPAAIPAENAPISAQSPRNPDSTAPVGKRPRGRPKGSKATKVRKDKGLKKDRAKAIRGPNESRYPGTNALTNMQTQSAIPEGGGRTDEDSWVDVEDSILDVAGSDGSGLFFTSAGPQQTPTRPLPDGNADGLRNLNHSNMTESGKKRGRPKGSKNRPKPPSTEISDNANGGADSNATTIPPQGIPGPAKPGRRPGPGRPKGSLTKKRRGSFDQAVTSGATSGHVDEHSTSQPGPFITKSPATDPHQSGALPDNSPGAGGGKRKRANKALKQTEMSLDSSQVMPTPGQTQSPDLMNVASTPSKKQKRSTDMNRTSGANNIVSHVVADSTSSSVVGLDAGSRGASSLVTGGPDGDFNASDFEALSSQLDQESPNLLEVQHSGERNQSILSHQRQQLQQQHLTAQKSVSDTLPFQDHVHGLSSPVSQQSQASRHQQQPQQSRQLQQQPQQQQQQQHQDLNQNHPPHQPQQHHAVPQMSNLGVSSTVSQHGVQSHIAGSIASSSLAVAQQLPQPTRSAQSYYAQNRPNSNSPFSQSLPLPQLQNQQQQPQQPHQQQQQQQQPKQQFVTQYSVQSQFNPQTQPQGFVSHSGQRSPQFGATNASRLRTTPDTYGTGSASGPIPFGSPAYNQHRRTNAAQGSPSLNGAYGTNGPSASHGLVHHGSPSFAPSRQDTRSAAPHAQGVASSAQGMQGFHSFDNQSLFDGINLDTAGGSGSLGLGGAATYNISGNVQRTSSQSNNYGPVPSMPSFDANMGGSNIRDRFYTIRR